MSGGPAYMNSFRIALLSRFFLGFTEAAYYPGVLFMLSKWYTVISDRYCIFTFH